MHAYGSLVVVFAIALAWPGQIHAEEGKKRELPACDPVATAKWLTSLYTLQKGKLAFDAGNANRLHRQISLAAKAKVSPGDDGHIIIDQEGFMPVSYSKSEGYETFFFKTPLTHLSPLSLDDFILYDKDILVQEDPSIFRKLGEALHYHFTGLATRKPDHHRVEDVLGYPADYYVWVVGGSSTDVFLKAYQGNDSHGLMLRVCSKATELGRAEIALTAKPDLQSQELGEERGFSRLGRTTGDRERLTVKQSSSIRVRILFISFRSAL